MGQTDQQTWRIDFPAEGKQVQWPDFYVTLRRFYVEMRCFREKNYRLYIDPLPLYPETNRFYPETW